MKKLLKTFTILLFIMVITACGTMSAKRSVIRFINEYKSLSESTLTSLEDVIKEESLNDNQKEVYRKLMKRQYKDLDYEILSEEYNGDNAKVEVKISVYDLYKAQNDAAIYLNNNYDLFKDEYGVYNSDKYVNYKLDKMLNVTDRIEYTLVFLLNKNEDGDYIINNIDNEMLEKIHGIYNYTNK